ncbi:MAG: hypothetical protein NTZ80_02045 [Patescibacteria group bacterium]|nr:hypothetical protein [Patescibacteria group bacterium]
MKTIKDLNKKTCYRLFKVISIVIFVLLTIMVALCSWGIGIRNYTDYGQARITCQVGNKKTFNIQKQDYHIFNRGQGCGQSGRCLDIPLAKKKMMLFDLCEFGKGIRDASPEMETLIDKIIYNLSDTRDIDPAFVIADGVALKSFELSKAITVFAVAEIVLIVAFWALFRVIYYIALGRFCPKRK